MKMPGEMLSTRGEPRNTRTIYYCWAAYSEYSTPCPGAQKAYWLITHDDLSHTRIGVHHTLLAGLTRQLDELRTSLDPELDYNDPVFCDEMAPREDPGWESYRAASSKVSRLPAKDGLFSGLQSCKLEGLEIATRGPELGERPSCKLEGLEIAGEGRDVLLKVQRAALGLMHAKAFLTPASAAALRQAHAASPKHTPRTNKSKQVKRLVKAIELFDKYSKVAEEDAKQARNKGMSVAGNLRRILGIWEQAQLLKESGLDQEVTDKMSRRALASAEASLHRPSHTRLHGQTTHRVETAREGQVVDKALHLAYIRTLAQFLGCDKALLDYELLHANVSGGKERLFMGTQQPVDEVRAQAPKTARLLPMLHSTTVAIKSFLHLNQVSTHHATFDPSSSQEQRVAKQQSGLNHPQQHSYAEKEAARKKREHEREREMRKIRLLPMTQVPPRPPQLHNRKCSNPN